MSILGYWPLEESFESIVGPNLVRGVLGEGLTEVAFDGMDAVDGTSGGLRLTAREGDPSTAVWHVVKANLAAPETGATWVQFFFVPRVDGLHSEVAANGIGGISLFQDVTAPVPAAPSVRFDLRVKRTPALEGKVRFFWVLKVFDGAAAVVDVLSSDLLSEPGGLVTLVISTGRNNVKAYHDDTLLFDKSFTAIPGLVVRTPTLFLTASALNYFTGLFSHLVVGTGDAPPIADRLDAGRGHAGETAVARFTRLTTEEGIRAEIDATQAQIDASPQEMGPQRTETVLSMLNEVARTDQGILAEIRNAPGLRYVPRGRRYNQPYALTLDAAADEIVNPLRPTNDDQRIRNDITVTKPRGGDARATDDAHIGKHGVYDESIQANPSRDAGLLQIAGWRLHLGTWPPEGFPGKLRLPTITTDLAIAPQLIASWIALEEGDRIAVRNLPSQYPLKDLDLIVEGTTETITAQSWMVELHCSPAGPWTVGVLGSSASGEVAGEPPSKLDTEGSELAAAIGAADTTLSVAVTGPLWTTDAAEFPFQLMLGAEVMRVTAITGAVSPQSFTVTRAVNGISKSHAVGAKVSLANPMVLAL